MTDQDEDRERRQTETMTMSNSPNLGPVELLKEGWRRGRGENRPDYLDLLTVALGAFVIGMIVGGHIVLVGGWSL